MNLVVARRRISGVFEESASLPPAPHKRRSRYGGKYPRRFEDKYKEHARNAETVAKVLASGKTPAGTHRPIMLNEVLQVLAPRAGDVAVDCTLGYGGHAQAILPALLPGGRLIALDADGAELIKTRDRLRALGFDEAVFTAQRSNFAGLPQVLAARNLPGADLILADLGVSSMQIDDPARGFSMKFDGPLDMRMNPHRGQPASAWLQRVKKEVLARVLEEGSDEPNAAELGAFLAGNSYSTTRQFANAIHTMMGGRSPAEVESTIRRVFQAVRIAVNDEFAALETFLRNLPACLKPGGRATILTFHSGEDRRVKKSFAAFLRDGTYSDISGEVVRPTLQEQRSNPRSTSAKLRWARRKP